MNDIKKVTEKMYRAANPETKMDVPSYAYEQVEAANRRRLKSGKPITLYEWCLKEKVDAKRK